MAKRGENCCHRCVRLSYPTSPGRALSRRLKRHFNDIETELVNKLDSLFMSESKSDDISRAFFISQLRALFESSNVDDQLRQRVSDFLDSVDLFLELLMNVRELPEGDEFQDDRVIATLRLMNFIRRIGRDEIYIKYVHQLVNVSLSRKMLEVH
jgi:dedicator of cytokinesis protein 3